jgi:nitroimidazol reductase NimA-like FMN-containing flavoprotein (pyridoxamine 5'-phosphate oxidase superfamily)
MSFNMTKQEREAFLADVHVGIVSIPEEGRGPLAVPVWYAYEPGREVWFTTAKTSRKGELLARARRISLCVQTEIDPYKYVSVEGPVVRLEPADLERHERPMAHRYYGKTKGDKYIETIDRSVESVVVRMKPERWYSVDYSKE